MNDNINIILYIYKLVIRRKLIATLAFTFKMVEIIKIERQKKTISVTSKSRYNL